MKKKEAEEEEKEEEEAYPAAATSKSDHSINQYPPCFEFAKQINVDFMKPFSVSYKTARLYF